MDFSNTDFTSLTTSDKSRRPERKIEIAQSGNEARQVALADGSVPISSMNAPAGEAKNGADLPASPQWETMAEKTRNSDDAWLVAKGAKHPKNSMILEQEVHRQVKRCSSSVLVQTLQNVCFMQSTVVLMKNQASR